MTGTESGRFFRSSFPDPSAHGFRSAIWKHGVPSAKDVLVPLHATLVAALESNADADARAAGGAARDPKIGVTIVDDDEEIAPVHYPWARLRTDARKVAGLLAQRGIAHGDRVVMGFPTSYEFLVSFFALEYLGAIPVPAYPPAMMEKAENALERIAHIANHSGATACLTVNILAPVLGGLAHQVKTLREIIAMEKVIEQAESASDPTSLPKIRPSDTAFIQYTSGSTGHPKGVVVTHANVCANIHTTGQAIHVTRDDSLVSWLPLYHDMGLVGGFLSALFFHMPLVLMSPLAFLVRPIRWLRALSDYKATMSLAPNFAYGLCVKRVRPADREGLDLSKWRSTLNGAEPVNYRTVVDFQRAYEPFGYRGETMYPVYGLAESVVAVTFPRPGEPVRFLTVERAALADGRVVQAKGVGTLAVVGVGRAMPGHDVAIVDAEGNSLEEDMVGHVVVRGPSVMRGYYNDPERTAEVVRDGCLWTGDLGFFHDGVLFITGRAKDIIIARGHNHYAEDVERMAERIEGLRPGGSAAFAVYDEEKASDLAVIVCETRVKDEAERAAIAEKLSRAVSEHCGLKLDEIVFAPPGTIPKTSSGKRQRALTRERYLAGELLSQKKTTKLRMAMVFARSATGFATMLGRRMTGRRAPP